MLFIWMRWRSVGLRSETRCSFSGFKVHWRCYSCQDVCLKSRNISSWTSGQLLPEDPKTLNVAQQASEQFQFQEDIPSINKLLAIWTNMNRSLLRSLFFPHDCSWWWDGAPGFFLKSFCGLALGQPWTRPHTSRSASFAFGRAAAEARHSADLLKPLIFFSQVGGPLTQWKLWKWQKKDVNTPVETSWNVLKPTVL